MNLTSRTQQFILFAASIVAAVWFFAVYPSQDPRSIIDRSYTEAEIEARAVEQLNELGYSISDYTITGISISSNAQLLDSLQHNLGRQKAIEILDDTTLKNINPFYREVTFAPRSQVKMAENDQEVTFGENEEELHLHFDLKGRFRAFVNSTKIVPNRLVNRKALQAVFVSRPDSVQRLVFAAVSDSLLGRLLYFDLQKETGSYDDYTRKQGGRIQSNLTRGIPYRYSKNDAQALATYWLEKTGWKASEFVRDSVSIQRIGDANAANIHFTLAEPVLGQQLHLEVLVAPTGALLQLQPHYNLNGETTDSLWQVVIPVLFLIFIIWILIIFFLRMRARAVDTRQALIGAVILGLTIIVFIFLSILGPAGIFISSTTTAEIIATLVGLGFVCALACLAFFILFAVGESITRQYYPEKLQSYDYLRQGMIFNKPIGSVILQSVALAFTLSGIWTLLLLLFPQLYISVSSVWVSGEAALPALYFILQNIWFSALLMLSFVLVMAGKVMGRYNRWLAGILIVVAFGLTLPVLSSMGPFWLEFSIGALLGIVLFLIYLKWDFLTLLLSHFLFLCLLGSASGWIISQSPDLLIFIWVLVLFVILAAIGIFALYFGEDERKLPDYTPEYVEAQAREERIKQELQIARRVQRSFLPIKTPEIKNLDLAAVCKPAYETGGDYYDFIQLSEHQVAVAIGDVSGKGIEAAFYMTFIKGILHSLSHEMYAPAEVLKRANRYFYENASNSTFISLIYGVIDLKKQTFTFARAGHNPVLYLNKNNNKIEELRPDGLGIGLTNEKIFSNKITEIKLSITDSDMFLLYTDGITEALNSSHQFYGTDRLMKVITEHKSESASTLISTISGEVESFIGLAEQHDDMTLMAIRFGSIKD